MASILSHCHSECLLASGLVRAVKPSVGAQLCSVFHRFGGGGG